jgi:hypothetical protein
MPLLTTDPGYASTVAKRLTLHGSTHPCQEDRPVRSEPAGDLRMDKHP